MDILNCPKCKDSDCVESEQHDHCTACGWAQVTPLDNPDQFQPKVEEKKECCDYKRYFTFTDDGSKAKLCKKHYEAIRKAVAPETEAGQPGCKEDKPKFSAEVEEKEFCNCWELIPKIGCDAHDKVEQKIYDILVHVFQDYANRRWLLKELRALLELDRKSR